eukprot:m.755734 g.755734  ORF g.755734 m.755734 type:complete len:488 (+) comp59015_c0_seq12:107-1570(+)
MPAMTWLLCAALWSLVRADIYDISLTSSNSSAAARAFSTEAFGFLTGGQAILSVSCNSVPAGNLSFLVVSSSAVSAGASDSFCSSPPTTQTWVNIPAAAFQNLSYSVVLTAGMNFTDTFYAFVLMSCPPVNVSSNLPPAYCEAELTLLNPGGEHLSSDQIKIPEYYRILLIVWGVLAAAWLILFLRWFQFRNGLAFYICLMLCIKVSDVALEYRLFTVQSHTGRVNPKLKTTEEVIAVLELVFFILFFFLASSGWCVSIPRLPGSVARHAVGIFVVLTASLLATQWVHPYIVIITILYVILIISATFSFTGRNIELLHRKELEIRQRVIEMHLERQIAISTAIRPLIRKIALLRSSRLVFTAFVVLWAITSIASGFLKEHRDVSTLLTEAVALALYVSVMKLFRLRNFTKYLPKRPPPSRPAEPFKLLLVRVLHADASSFPTLLVHLPQNSCHKTFLRFLSAAAEEPAVYWRCGRLRFTASLHHLRF